ncbi:E3 ubiquitin-protein ligase TRIM45-like [Sycon ciliatum]|uniref:E3 ubiquitin-protein ligase TRIM45-like n=1 Tax=Sycon ciliatum TaxID=27933 RepID=UPI0031F66779
MSDRLCCASCGSKARRLKLVSCLHAICIACLEKLVTFDGRVHCPKCFAKTPTPRSPASSLPDNYPKPTTPGQSASSSEPEPVLCDDCAEDEPATARCVNCGVNLCETHAASHPLFRATRNHKVASLTAEQEKNAPRTTKLQHYCAFHPTQVLSNYCVPCDQLACQQCLDTGAHSKPEQKHQLVPIQNAVQEMRQTVDTNFSSCLPDGDRLISTALDKVKKEMDCVNEAAEYASEEITEQFKQLKIALDAREQTLLEEVDQLRNKKLTLLESQVARLEDGIEVHQAASELSQSCDDDTDFVKMAHWLNNAVDRRKAVEGNDLEPCARSQIVFGRDNAPEVAGQIGNIGTVQDFADFTDGLAAHIENAFENANLKIVIKGNVPSGLSQECINRLRFNISVHDEDSMELPTTLLKEISGERLELTRTQLSTEGLLTVSVQYAEAHLQGSPKVKNDDQPIFDLSRCHGDITISSNERTIRKSVGDSTRATCSSVLPAKHGISCIRMRIDETSEYGDVHICACSSAKPKLKKLHDTKAEIFGWCGHVPDPKCNGGRLGQQWQTGDIISLELDRDNQTLTGHHERTDSREVLHGITGTCCWYVTLCEHGDQVTIL